MKNTDFEGAEVQQQAEYKIKAKAKMLRSKLELAETVAETLIKLRKKR